MFANNEPPAPSVDAMSSALPCKTPVSLLQELCMRRGISPKYDLLQIEGQVHEPTFVYRVTVGEYTASGSGQSKKKAKHAAAKAVLDIIIHGGGPPSATPPHNNGTTDCSLLQATTQNNELSKMVSPYDDGIPGNPVGQLQELCMTRRWPPPTYELTAEEGFPHERTFAIACTIATYKEIGHGKSKKLAKRQAAYSMLQKLTDLPQETVQNDILQEDEEDLTQKLAMRYADLKNYKNMNMSRGDQRKVSSFHAMLKNKAGPNLKRLQTVALNSGINFTQTLKDIAYEANFATTYVDIEETNIAGEYQCLLQLSTLPVAVCHGTGNSVEEAQSSAALNALEYLRIVSKPKQEQ